MIADMTTVEKVVAPTSAHALVPVLCMTTLVVRLVPYWQGGQCRCAACRRPR